MATQQAHLDVMTNNPYKYEHIPSHDFRDVAFTKCHILMDRRRLLLCSSVVERRGTTMYI